MERERESCPATYSTRKVVVISGKKYFWCKKCRIYHEPMKCWTAKKLKALRADNCT